MPNKNTIALIFTGLLTIGFFVCGLLDILDYIIVKTLLIAGLATFMVYAYIIVSKSSKTN